MCKIDDTIIDTRILQAHTCVTDTWKGEHVAINETTKWM